MAIVYSTIICSIICNRGLRIDSAKQCYFCFTHSMNSIVYALCFLDIALRSQRDVKTMLSIITSYEPELLNAFNKILILPLMSKPKLTF